MDYAEADQLVRQLSTGFETLHEEYKKLFGRHEALERKLATARDQYNELAKLYGAGSSSTPPLSLTSSPGRKKDSADALPSVNDILASRSDHSSQDAAKSIRLATCASQRLKPGLPKLPASTAEGVKIWSGPSADAVPTGSQKMPSISESPMEQDFTIEGMPSNLGCPFASMSGKKLSSHAASVLSRYNPGGSAGGAPSSTPLSSVSRVNGRESFNNRSRRESAVDRERRASHRASFNDPIKAEICGMSDHDAAPTEAPVVAKSAVETHVQSNAEPGVCPIRFLDQHSPEEVAKYFENHKHDLPRSHEVCVKRYQSNEMQIKELDARYGNLVSMIQGLGAKHQPMLPAEPPEGELAAEEDNSGLDAKDAEKVRNWANSVSPQPQAEGQSTAAQDGDGNMADDEGADSDACEDRQPRFARPLRDIRVGESPSRPWGIPVPVKYLEKVEGNVSEASSQPAQIANPDVRTAPAGGFDTMPGEVKPNSKGKCPFGFDQSGATKPAATVATGQTAPGSNTAQPAGHGEKVVPGLTFIAPETSNSAEQKAEASPANATARHNQSRMVFTGPVFIGYSAEDAARILKDSGLGRP
ncbi:hypothetical protein WHR41_02348 [Cladosporium halotolerans]|uniref:Uncharacterized protein n=1 Tax=Cladosporium halotolerans TaxID=1052096 RepID=A0AB34KYB8_9PEZI